MLKQMLCFTLLALLAVPAMAQSSPDPPAPSFVPRGADKPDEKITGPFKLESGTYAVFHTTEGDFIAQLFPDKAPNTVENFVGLATGAKPWTHPITLTQKTEPLYNNTAIYHIAEDIVIRGGDPVGKGVGGPGYNIEIESSPDLTFETPGMLAMERAGAQSSGSRWFVALTLFPGWDERYAIIGRVVGGLDVVRVISRKPTRRPGTPLDPTMVNSIEIVDVPANMRATASFAEEKGKRFLNVDPDFEVVAAPAPTPAPAEEATAAETETTDTEDAEGVTRAESVQSGEASATGTPE